MMHYKQLAQQHAASIAASSASSAASSSPPQQAHPQVILSTSVPAPERFSGIVGLAVDDWLELLERWHVFYGRNDASRVSASAALLGGDALKSYNREASTNGEPNTWTSFKVVMRKRWHFVETEYIVRKALRALIVRGPAMPPARYAELFQQQVTRLPNSEAPEFQPALLFDFCDGLIPSLRQRVFDKQHKTLQAAILQVCRSDATRAALGITSTDSKSSFGSSSSSTDAMDLSSLGSLSPDDRNVAMAAMRHMYSATNGFDNEVSSTSHINNITSGPVAPEHFLAQLSSLTKQVAALSQSHHGSRPQGKSSGGRTKRPAHEIPDHIAEARKRLGWCIRCGITPFKVGVHSSRKCDKTIDLTRIPTTPAPNSTN
jgi:hypothetical protein